MHEVEEHRPMLEERAHFGGEMQGEPHVHEEVHGFEEVGVLSEQRAHFDGQVEREADIKQEVRECERPSIVEEEVDVRSWSSSPNHGSLDGNSEWLEGLVDVCVDCDINA